MKVDIESSHDNEAGSLDRFAKKLNRVNRPESGPRPTRPTRAVSSLRRDWSDDSGESVVATVRPKSGWLLKFFFWSLAFFLATMAVAVYVLFFSTNLVSASNIDLELDGPSLLRSGDELTLEISVKNRNRVTLRDVSLTVNYPAGTTDSSRSDQELSLVREELPDLLVGQTATAISRATVFGAQNSEQVVGVILEYQIPDSNAVFTKEASYRYRIGSAPVELTLELPSEINSDKLFTLELKVAANAQTLLRQLAVKIEYPEGFTATAFDPAPSSGDNFWSLGDLPPGAEREIKVTGALAGQNEELKSFKVTAGLDRAETGRELDAEYGSLFKTVALKRDFVAATIDLGGLSALAPGQNLTGWVTWQNNLTDRVINNTLRLYLDGLALDKRSVKTSSGFYDSFTNSIYWDKLSVSELGLLNPGQTGRVGFSFSALPEAALPVGQTGAAGEINLRLILAGTRITAEDTGREITTEVDRIVKLMTRANLDARAQYSIGPFTNTGPLPPRVGQETTYTVTWSVTNSANEIGAATVKTVLPPYARWLATVSPLDEKVVYRDTEREVTWDLGQVARETGRLGLARQVSFQIALVPSLSQLRQAVNLTGAASFSGLDMVTGQAIALTKPPVTTAIASDPAYLAGQDEVIE